MKGNKAAERPSMCAFPPKAQLENQGKYLHLFFLLTAEVVLFAGAIALPLLCLPYYSDMSSKAQLICDAQSVNIRTSTYFHCLYHSSLYFYCQGQQTGLSS